MNRSQLVEEVRKRKHNKSKDGPFFNDSFPFNWGLLTGAEEAIAVVRDALLAGETVKLPGLGTFRVVERKEQTYWWGPWAQPGRRPETSVPAHRTVVFKPAPALRRMKLEGHTDG